MRPIDMRVPEGSLLSAEFPRPVGGYTETILRMIDVIFSAFAQAAPERVVANAYGTINALSIAGKKSQRPALGDVQLLRRRAWRQPEGDGLNHGNAPISTATIPPMEILEAAYPVMFRQWALRPTARARARIAAGWARSTRSSCWKRRPRPSCSASAAASRPKGVAGGGAGGAERFSYEQDDGWHGRRWPRRCVGIKLARASRAAGTPGGGGYGPPRRAPPRPSPATWRWAT
jgi:N-methylhydantoinase B